MTWSIKIEADNENLDSVLLKVYSDIKKKKYITRQELPKVLTKLDCECKDEIKYCVSEVCR